MKNKKLIVSIIIVIIIMIIIGLLIFWPKTSGDNKEFSQEYSIKVPKSTTIVYLDDESLIQAFSTKDKLVFIGRKSSKETQKAVRKLLKTAEDNGIDKIYYYDTEGLAKKDEIVNELTAKLGKEGITSPTLFLIKNKKVDKIEEGLNKNIEEKYEEIMIAYIMCNTPDC